MAQDDTRPDTETPEVDLLDQHTPVEPDDPPDGLSNVPPTALTSGVADEADLLEQARSLPGGDDEYPHDGDAD